MARVQRRLGAGRGRRRRARSRDHTGRRPRRRCSLGSTIDYARSGQATAVGGATGAVVGLVAITPAAGYVTPLSAIAIGVLGAVASNAAMQLRHRRPVDDTLDVFACHGVAGIVGALLTGVFATKSVNPGGADGLIHGNPRLFGVQRVAVVCTIAFSAPVTAIALARLRALGSLRAAGQRDVRRRRQRARRTRLRSRHARRARRRRVKQE